MIAVLESGNDGFEFDHRHIKAILMDMLVGGVDTLTTVIKWVLSELFKHLKIMKRLQDELKEVVGMDKMIDESHLTKLGFLDCIMKESLWLHPIVPLIPRESLENCIVNGFSIPKDSRILVNLWSISRNPEVWTDPLRFDPDRFIGSNIDVRGGHFELIPFGAGRRICPELQLGLTISRLIVARLVHSFDWKLPDDTSPKDLDMTTSCSLVMARANPLKAIPTYRLHK